MERLTRIVRKKKRCAIGLMSGTSADGVDAALVQIHEADTGPRLELQTFATYPYPPGLQEYVLEHSKPGSGSVDALCRLNVVLGEVFARAALQLLADTGIDPQEVDLIGSHGQTVHHLPEPFELFGVTARGTLQLGEPAIIARRTGIVTVADFRPADMAAGGQGAPLVPYFDYVVFRSQNENRVLLNIGGIANVTVLPKGCRLDDLIAFDTGPGNVLIDALVQRHFGLPFDRNAEIARRGSVQSALLDHLLGHPFFRTPPPKSTGREVFGGAVLQDFEASQITPEDAVATATAVTAYSIADALQRYVFPRHPVDRLLVSGGGVRNPRLMELLQEALSGQTIETTEAYGVPVDAKEAMCFALLANETVVGRVGNVPSCTGAERPVILGKICF